MRKRGRAPIVVVPRFQHREIGLRFAQIVELNRIAHRDDTAVADHLNEPAASAFAVPACRTADRKHGDKLSLDEFDPVVFRQDADLPHSMVFSDGQRTPVTHGLRVSNPVSPDAIVPILIRENRR